MTSSRMDTDLGRNDDTEIYEHGRKDRRNNRKSIGILWRDKNYERSRNYASANVATVRWSLRRTIVDDCLVNFDVEVQEMIDLLAVIRQKGVE